MIQAKSIIFSLVIILILSLGLVYQLIKILSVPNYDGIIYIKKRPYIKKEI